MVVLLALQIPKLGLSVIVTDSFPMKYILLSLICSIIGSVREASRILLSATGNSPQLCRETILIFMVKYAAERLNYNYCIYILHMKTYKFE